MASRSSAWPAWVGSPPNPAVSSCTVCRGTHLTYGARPFRAHCRMTSLRLLADDLTGALDAAAEFVPLTGPVQAFWHGAIPAELPPNATLDSGTRELSTPHAAGIVRRLAHHLSPDAGRVRR